VSRPRHLDLYGCEGGSCKGYDDAGFDVYTVDLFTDIKGGFSQKRNPYPSCKMDVLAALRILLDGGRLPFTHRGGRVEWLSLDDFSSVSASPPCQHASAGTRAMRAAGDDRHPALIEPTRDLLEQTGLPYVIENVSGAALRDPVTLCGSMFGLMATDADGELLHLERHRLFETNWGIAQPEHTCWPAGSTIAGSYGGSRQAKVRAGTSDAEAAWRDRYCARVIRGGGYVPRSKAVQQELLGIDWMTKRGMHQSLPPAYTRWVGLRLRAHVLGECAA
jgi:DNA (cytosine-5)-methyltransferase 1